MMQIGRRSLSGILAVALCISGMPQLPAVAVAQNDSAVIQTVMPKADSTWYTDDYFAYEIYSDHAVVRDFRKEAKELVIPDTVKGVPVTEVARSFFNTLLDTGVIEKIVFPDSIKKFNGALIGLTEGYNESVKEIVLPSKITELPQGLLRQFRALTTIEIPKTVSSMDGAIFSCCYALKSVVIPEGVKVLSNTFTDCMNLEEVILPSTLEEVNWGVFSNCKSLKTINLGNKLTTVTNHAFDGCTSLEAINVAEGGEKYVSEDGLLYQKTATSTYQLIRIPLAKQGVVPLKEGTTYLGAICAEDCTALEEIALPDTVSSIYKDSLNNCGIVRMHLPERLNYMDAATFANCPNMEEFSVDEKNATFSVRDGVLFSEQENAIFAYPAAKEAESYAVPDGIVCIKEGAFQQAKVKSVTIPDSVYLVYSSSFEGCDAVSVEGQISYVDNWAISYNHLGEENPASISFRAGTCGIADGLMMRYPSATDAPITEVILPDTLRVLCANSIFSTAITELTIPASVRIMQRFAVNVNTALEKINIESGLEWVLDTPFYESPLVTELHYPDTVRTLPARAFAGLTGLQKVTIPNGIRKLYGRTFDGCKDLKEVVIPESVVELSPATFNSSGVQRVASTNQKCVTGKVTKIPKYHVITVFRDFVLSCCPEKVRGLNVQMTVTYLK